ncbi:MAG: hypothetical protein JXL97_03595 [Bacteroidales bacterium]|nr:hypothetical protein [Bacteroidales bacterium]
MNIEIEIKSPNAKNEIYDLRNILFTSNAGFVVDISFENIKEGFNIRFIKD